MRALQPSFLVTIVKPGDRGSSNHHAEVSLSKTLSSFQLQMSVLLESLTSDLTGLGAKDSRFFP